MNRQKRDNYTLNGSFHTIEIKSNGKEIEKDIPTVTPYITTRINQSGELATSKINANKYGGDIFSFSEFKDIFHVILLESGIRQYRITRADLRLDNYDDAHYQAFAKLNKYLISAVALTYQVKNKYKTLDLLSENQLSISIRNDYFQLENYDRSAKNIVTDNQIEPATSRLEERTTHRQWRQVYGGFLCDPDENMQFLEEEFITGWAKRWEKAKGNLRLVQDSYNDALVEKYYRAKNSKPVQFRTLTDFLINYQQSIFTSRQMIDLLKRLGIKNAENRAKYHKRKYGIEYFSASDVDFAINEIMRATRKYFRS